MESHFLDLNARQQNPRNLQPHLLLQKYTIGWQCSVCGLYFELSESERHSTEAYDGEVPRRLRRMFENHKCGSLDLCCVRQRPSSAVQLEEE
jgi:hypothetical protein